MKFSTAPLATIGRSGVYALNALCGRQEELLAVARDHYPPPVKDIEHAIFAAAAG